MCLSLADSHARLGEFLPLLEENATRAGTTSLLWERKEERAARAAAVSRTADRNPEASESWWDWMGDAVEAIDRDELTRRLRRREVVLVDVRPSEEFEAGHIAGARSIPIEELQDRLAELPADREVVAYCRGPFCAYAHRAVRELRAAGREARRLEDGWPEWQLANRSTTKSAA